MQKSKLWKFSTTSNNILGFVGSRDGFFIVSRYEFSDCRRKLGAAGDPGIYFVSVNTQLRLIIRIEVAQNFQSSSIAFCSFILGDDSIRYLVFFANSGKTNFNHSSWYYLKSPRFSPARAFLAAVWAAICLFFPIPIPNSFSSRYTAISNWRLWSGPQLFNTR